METQNELEKEIGTIESERKILEPKKVKIVKVEIVVVGEKKNLKVSCEVQHPDIQDTIKISRVSLLIDKKVQGIGLWHNLDKEDKVQKGSALASFMNYLGAKKVIELEGKEVDTELEGKYLAFKAY